MRIYLDACCLNRLTDDQNQPRIREEAGAVERILKLVRDGIVQWISSDALADEIDRNPDPERKSGNLALHLACTEAARVDVLLTTDDSFIPKASRGDGRPRVLVRNPRI